MREQLERSEEQVRRLQRSEAVLREAINAARFALQKIDNTSPLLNQPLPSPPPSTHATGSLNGDATAPGAVEDSTATTSAIIGAETTSAHPANPWAGQDLYGVPEISFKDDEASFAVRDDITGLTLGLPLTQDFDSVLQYEGFGKFSFDTFSIHVLT